MEKILRIAQQNPYGFTYNIKTETFVKYGYVVAYLETQNSFDEIGLEKVLKHAQDHDGIIGGWLNEENDKYYFDSCKMFSNFNRAMKFAKDNKQIAFFDLTNLEEIKVK